MKRDRRGKTPAGELAVEERAQADDLFALVAEPRRTAAGRVDGVSIGTLQGFDTAGAPLVDYPENGSGTPVAARATLTPGAEDVGREVALLFEGGDARRPILIGCLQRPIAPALAHETPHNVTLDGERMVFDAKQEIVLRCGRATITLTRAGKILIRGAYVSSRSSGVNRVKGGSVQIN